ncbi:pyridoxamine 5'-phosphate oxidase family protein [Parasulfitobacter algicola]|uniref:Pyridoxamine 5'-phosphate oxidase family protein n=1 Tax=Parasulfitobacter algicola TaxID=2614809 RepID=A0ABX2IVT4_9RHOB|nr:pyridoxamine 5'-phosphate oxidase family protein [Sulfitobacter algicola]NSX54381.1 pyridoxamine 5'-phosphate oxidase family protein [Sulfitobacter algicola]
MAKQFDQIEDTHQRFIEDQYLFFVGTAATDGRVNVSPKGMDSLRVLAPNRIIWLNLTGSGNETAGHLLNNPRMTLMWCSFAKRPMILRLYGTARAVHHLDDDWHALYDHFPKSVGARQIYDLTVDLVQTSCGYSIPFLDYVGERHVLQKWGEDKGQEGVRAHWATRNTETIDGMPTHIIEKNLGVDDA